MRTPLAIAGLLLAAAAAQVVYYYDRLPDPVASHFGAGGQANGWSSRIAFFSLFLGIALFTQIVILGLALLLGRFPDRLINLPNRDYWLMPERRDTTLSYVQRRIAWSAAAVMMFLLASQQLVIRANLFGSGRLETGWLWLLLALLVVTMLSVPIRILKRFSKR